jgi:hypothetical protein
VSAVSSVCVTGASEHAPSNLRGYARRLPGWSRCHRHGPCFGGRAAQAAQTPYGWMAEDPPNTRTTTSNTKLHEARVSAAAWRETPTSHRTRPARRNVDQVKRATNKTTLSYLPCRSGCLRGFSGEKARASAARAISSALRSALLMMVTVSN